MKTEGTRSPRQKAHDKMSYEHIYGVSLLDDLHNYFPEFLYNNSRFTNVGDMFRYMNEMIDSQFNLFNYGLNLHRSRVQQFYNYPRAGSIRHRPTFETPVVQTTTNTQRVEVHTQPQAQPQPQQPQQPPSQSQQNRGNVQIRSPVRAGNTARRVTPAQPRVLAASYSVFPQMNQSVEEISVEGVLPSFMRGGFGMNLGADLDISGSSIAQQTEQLLTGLFGGAPLMTESPLTNIFQNLIRPPEFMEPVTIRPTPQQIATATTTYSFTGSDSDTDSEMCCAICQENMEMGEIARQVHHCRHIFHQNCLDRHFQTNVRCPMCRYDIRDYVPNQQTQTQAQAQTQTAPSSPPLTTRSTSPMDIDI